MKTITIPAIQFKKILFDVETLIEDIATILDQDEITKKRMEEIESKPSIGKSEKDLDIYLKKKGIKID